MRCMSLDIVIMNPFEQPFLFRTRKLDHKDPASSYGLVRTTSDEVLWLVQFARKRRFSHIRTPNRKRKQQYM